MADTGYLIGCRERQRHLDCNVMSPFYQQCIDQNKTITLKKCTLSDQSGKVKTIGRQNQYIQSQCGDDVEG